MATDDNSKDSDAWLAEVYGAKGAGEVQRTYDGWAGHYDDSLADFGYTNFIYAAALLNRFSPPGIGEILDAGCGTGALGRHLELLGYESLVGIDLSRGMLARARDTGCYRELDIADLGQPLDFSDDRFTACVSIGVLTAGHAPPAALDELIRVTRAGGHLVFSVSKPAFDQCGFKEKLSALDGSDRWRRVFVSVDYAPMPNSASESSLTAKAYVYEIA